MVNTQLNREWYEAYSKLYGDLTENTDGKGDLIWDHTWEALEQHIVGALGEEWSIHEASDVWEHLDELDEHLFYKYGFGEAEWFE